MGTVYLAEQSEPIRRRVAVKVVKHGMDTSQILARFNNERQALARMDHPNVARIYDAGATPGGRPYFAMEYIEGVPLRSTVTFTVSPLRIASSFSCLSVYPFNTLMGKA